MWKWRFFKTNSCDMPFTPWWSYWWEEGSSPGKVNCDACTKDLLKTLKQLFAFKRIPLDIRHITSLMVKDKDKESIYLWNIFGVHISGIFFAVIALERSLLKSWIKDFAVESSIRLANGLCLSRDRRTSLSWHWLTLWWRFYVPPLSLGMWHYAGLGHKEVASMPHLIRM